MLEKLKQIYRNKILESVTEYNYDKYYYFYQPNTTDVFAIEKTISQNEYQLIKTSYIEKKIYDNNRVNQEIYEYLFESGTYPFINKKVKIILLDISNSNLIITSDIKDVLLNFYKEVIIINLDNVYIAFCMESYNIDLSQFVSSINFDFGLNIKLHDGIYLNPRVEGITLLNYLTIIKQYLTTCDEDYTDLTSPLINNNLQSTVEYINFIDEYVIASIFQDALIKDIILTYFKNDLNVSKTAKELYINRNSLLNKFEHIFNETGINLQKFSHACAMYLLTSFKGNKE